MGRRKASPTPRGELLGEFIARSAHASVPPARPSSAQSKVSAAAHGAPGKSGAATAATAVATVAASVTSAKSSPPGAHVNQPAAAASAATTVAEGPSTGSNKRKLPDTGIASSAKDTTVPLGGVSTSSTATLRSASKKASTVPGTSISSSPPPPPQPAEAPNKRQKVESAPRFSSRLRNLLNDGDSSDVKATPKSGRQTRAQRKALEPVQQGQVKELTTRQKEAVAPSPAPAASNGVPRTLPGVDGHVSGRRSAPREAKAGIEILNKQAEDVIPLGQTQGRFGIQPASQGLQDPGPRPSLAGRPNVAEDDGRQKTIPDGAHTAGPSSQNSLPAAPATRVLPAPHPMYFPTVQPPVSATIPASSSPSSQPAAAAAAAAATYNWPYTPQAASWSTPDVGTHTFINSTKGQKVKGRPLSKAIRQAQTANRVRNVANTYPRKQPFKAQIMFDGYPSEDQPMREGLTLWEICQEYPNHLTGKVLEGFVQKEWSANELCACLKDDARKVLTDRPGKDKTMVFQKRLERIKKDLMAKDEFDQLMNGPEIRPDGRPTWVKRGNVRRR